MARSSGLSSDTARLDVEVILCHVLQCDRVYLRTWPERQLTPAQEADFDDLLAQRVEGHPVAHLTGRREFWTLSLKVNPHTLIPRPDTEVLVECALSLPIETAAASVLDLGTGTGAIALALASEKPAWNVCGVDCFQEVVDLAILNAQENKLSNVRFMLSDWFSAISDTRFDLIVSNPPYIDKQDEHLSQGDVRFEPASALVSEEEGMADIRQIVDEARNYLLPNGWLVFEHGFEQGAPVREALLAVGYESVETFEDYGGNERVTRGLWPGNQTLGERNRS